jgi:carbamoylphosphate synthase small subunit
VLIWNSIVIGMLLNLFHHGSKNIIFQAFMVNLLFIVYNYMIVIILILGIDTRMLTKKLRKDGTMLGKV